MITESIGAETGRNRYLELIAAVGADGIDEAVFCRLGFLDRHDDRSLDSRRFEENIFVLIDLHAPVGIAAGAKDLHAFGAALFPGGVLWRRILPEQRILMR